MRMFACVPSFGNHGCAAYTDGNDVVLAAFVLYAKIFDCLPEPLRQFEGCEPIGVGQNDGEFLAAKARHCVA